MKQSELLRAAADMAEYGYTVPGYCVFAVVRSIPLDSGVADAVELMRSAGMPALYSFRTQQLCALFLDFMACYAEDGERIVAAQDKAIEEICS